MASKYLTFRVFAARLITWLLFRSPITVKAGRHRLLFDPASGHLLPIVAGGDGSEEGDGDGDGSGDDSDAGDADGEGDSGDGSGDGEGDSGDGEGSADGSGDGDAADTPKTNWTAEARKHERRAKAERKARLDAERKLKEREDADKSEQEKAIDAAREEGRTAALTEAQKERRADRLELEVTRLATRGIKVEVQEDGKTVEKTLKFADPDDALAHLERAIKRGDVDDDGIFDDAGKIQKDELTTALSELLDEKPHLVAKEAGSNGGGGGRRTQGGADSGKGSGSSKSLEELSPDEHLQQVQGS